MVRLILFLLAIVALASGLAWLADRPGELVLNWEGYEVHTSVFRAVVILSVLMGLAVLALAILRQIWQSPANVGHFFNKRREKRGLDALSSGMIAIGAGDRSTATRYAIQARKALPNEPLTHLLRAQAAQLTGDKATARRIFEAMLGSPDTEQLGLRGLFLEAEREKETEAARQFAERAMMLNPKLSWPVDALFDLQCKVRDWDGALDTLAVAKRNNHVERGVADRRRAVLLTAQAQELEDSDPEKALNLAQEAAGLAHDLVPAAAIAGRLLASRGLTPKATKIIQRTWARAPHPDLATAYAFARLGDSPRDRLDRVQKLAAQTPNNIESPLAVAATAIEARDFAVARKALEPLAAEGRLTHRACLLMARVEGESGDRGRVREWLARAVNAGRDPAWTADGIVSDRWAPVSPVTGQLDAFQWRVPVESLDKSEDALLAAKLDELVALGAPDPTVERIIDVTAPAAGAVKGTAPAAGATKAPADASKAPARPPRGGASEVVDVETVEAATDTVPADRPAPMKAEVGKIEAGKTETGRATQAAAPGPALKQASVTVKTAAATTVAPATSAAAKPQTPAARGAALPPTPAPGSTGSAASVAATSDKPAPAAPAAPLARAAQGSIDAPVTVAVTPGASAAKPAASAPAKAASPTPAAVQATAGAGAKPPQAGAATTQRPITQHAGAAGRDGKDAKGAFVPPRVPDDPGLDDGDDLPRSPLRSLRAGH